MSKHFKVKVFNTAKELGNAAAEAIMKQYEENGKLVLGVPWGSTPLPIFDAMAEIIRQKNLDLSNLHLIFMDEYVEKWKSGYAYINESLTYSGHYHVLMGILKKLPEKQAKQIESNILFPDPSSPEGFEKVIQKLGGVDIFLVAVGAHDGHVAMCGPGTELESYTHIIKLPETVRDYNFEKMREHFKNSKENVPKYGVSMGLQTILKSKKLFFIAHGRSKASIVRILLKANEFDPEWPVTFLWKATGKTEIYLDEAAAGEALS